MPLSDKEVERINNFFAGNWNDLTAYIIDCVCDPATYELTKPFNIRAFINHARNYARTHGISRNITELLAEKYSDERAIKDHYNRMLGELRKKRDGVLAPPPPPPPPSPASIDDLPGIPADESNAEIVRQLLNLSPGNARLALRITQAVDSVLVTDDGTRLIHDTRRSQNKSEGVTSLNGGHKVITFFYLKQAGRYFLVAYGVHIRGEGRESVYRITRAIPKYAGLENQCTRFE